MTGFMLPSSVKFFKPAIQIKDMVSSSNALDELFARRSAADDRFKQSGDKESYIGELQSIIADAQAAYKLAENDLQEFDDRQAAAVAYAATERDALYQLYAGLDQVYQYTQERLGDIS